MKGPLSGTIPLVPILLTLGFVLVLGIYADDVKLHECAHDVKGKIKFVNDKEIMIEGFSYDGMGPASWWHGQLKPASRIENKDPKTFVTLPYPETSCDKLTNDTYKDATITLKLPRSIKDFKSIGILCYKYCHNFGHFEVPDNLVVDAAPEPAAGETKPECQVTGFSACDQVNQGAIDGSECKPGKPGKTNSTGGGEDGKAGSGTTKTTLTLTPAWFIIPSILLFIGKY